MHNLHSSEDERSGHHFLKALGEDLLPEEAFSVEHPPVPTAKTYQPIVVGIPHLNRRGDWRNCVTNSHALPSHRNLGVRLHPPIPRPSGNFDLSTYPNSSRNSFRRSLAVSRLPSISGRVMRYLSHQ